MNGPARKVSLCHNAGNYGVRVMIERRRTYSSARLLTLITMSHCVMQEVVA